MPTHIFIALALFSAFMTPEHSVTTDHAPALEEPPSTLPVPAAEAAERAEITQNAETDIDREEILWLARIIYSETKIEPEMRLVAWVVRNRVDTGFRGTTYKEVALSKNQFSGLSQGYTHYAHHMSLDFDDTNNRSWMNALKVAREVYYADDSTRPFPDTVRHFYSPIAVSPPSWAHPEKLYHTVAINADAPARFAFYIDVH